MFKYYKIAKKRWTLHKKIRYYKDFAILLFDEIEKADPKIHQSLLSVMSDWKITFPTWKEENNKIPFSKETDLSNTIIIFTSNIWNQETINKSRPMWFIREDEISDKENKKEFKKIFEKHFSPEFIWRIDKFISFDQLEKKDIYKILKIEAKKIEESLKKFKRSRNIKLNIKNEVINDIIEKSYSARYWARPSIRMFQETIEADLNRIINSWQIDYIFNNYKNYAFTINISLKNWEYSYQLTKNALIKNISNNSRNRRRRKRYQNK